MVNPMRRDEERTPAVEDVPGSSQGEVNEEASSVSIPPDSIQNKVASIAPIDDLFDFPSVGAYLRSIGAKPYALKKARVQSDHGKYSRTIAEIRFDELGKVTASEGYQPTKAQQAAILEEWDEARFPSQQTKLWTGKCSPTLQDVPWAKGVEGENYFIAWNKNHTEIISVEQRMENEDGSKACIPWSYYTDHKWRMAQPDRNPIYGLDRIGNAGTVFVHEGAKAAAKVSKLISGNDWKDHPFGSDLRGYDLGATAHVGWVGGALNAHNTDWETLRRAVSARRVIIVLDNDDVGTNALRFISSALRGPLEAVIFGAQFDDGFDLGDPMPEALFAEYDGKRSYQGPSLNQLTQPATWATYDIPSGAPGRRAFAITADFAKDWRYITSMGMFVNLRQPETFYSKEQFNQLVRDVSDAADTATIMFRLRSIKVHGVTYAPGLPEGVINMAGQQMLNVWKPTQIRPVAGDPRPFLRYLFDLVPDRRERRALQKWIATLIAKPELRMIYAVLLISEAQGVGKTTLCNILAALVGEHNTSFPSQSSILNGNYTGWIANKRFIVVNELFDGGSGKSFVNSMKDKITDDLVEVNIKYQPQYTAPNRSHFIFCSNEPLPAFFPKQDRRWFIPTVTEKIRSRAYWKALRDWLDNGGLAITHQWAIDHVAKYAPVMPGDIAPTTAAKLQIIEKSRTEGEKLIADLAECLLDAAKGHNPQRIVMTVNDFKTFFQRELADDRARYGVRAINKGLMDAGLTVLTSDDRPKVNGRKVSVILNFTPQAGESLQSLVAKHRQQPAQLFGEEY
jgi:hypothetical protein